jgi:hypothetical protein
VQSDKVEAQRILTRAGCGQLHDEISVEYDGEQYILRGPNERVAFIHRRPTKNDVRAAFLLLGQ